MHLNQFSVDVPQATEISGGYAELPHGTQFTIELHNYRSVCCDANVVVDGKDIGTFRINPYGMATLERVPHDTGRFTFYTSTSHEAAMIRVAEVAESNRGLISATFTPELVVQALISPDLVAKGVPTRGTPTAQAGVTSGVTGLSGHSGQQFVSVDSITYDYSQRTTITLRLVCPSSSPHPLTPAPLSTPIPPPVR